MTLQSQDATLMVLANAIDWKFQELVLNFCSQDWRKPILFLEGRAIGDLSLSTFFFFLLVNDVSIFS